MKLSAYIKAICLLITILLIAVHDVSLFTAAEQAADFGTPVTDAAILENGHLRLEMQTSGRFVLTDLSSGNRWFSNPADETEDKISFGVNKERVMSQVLVTYSGKNVVAETASFAGCAATDGSYTELFKRNEKLICVYHFKDLGFDIPVEYEIDGNRLYTSVETDKIKELSYNRLISFTINPFFGAGTVDEDGYIMLPDGCGTTINFNNGKSTDNRLELDVLYGDRSKVSASRPVSSQPVLIPGFGIAKKYGTGFSTMFALATEGYIGGTLTSNIAGRETGSNYAYFTFLYRETATETMLDRTYAAKSRLIVSNSPQDTERFCLCYCFSNGEDNGISQMSENCRELLFPNAETNVNSDIPLYLDCIMGVRVKKNFLGIPYRSLRALTTLSDAENMISLLSENGISSFEIRMQGLSSDGYAFGKINNKLQIDRSLGNVSQLSQFQEKKSINVYPQVELTTFTRNGNGANRFFSSSSDLLLDTISLPKYSLAAAVEDKNATDARLLKPQIVFKAADKLEKDLTKKEIEGICPASLAMGTYCDHGKKSDNGITLTADILNKSLELLSEKHNILLEAPVFSAWSIADSILYLPDDSSHYNISDDTVPFLQMVLSGIIHYSSSAINFSGDINQSALRAIRNGSALAFMVTASPYSELDKTDARNLYAASFNECKESIIKIYSTVSDALLPVYGTQMVSYSQIQKDLTVSEYANGIRIVVNTSKNDLTLNGKTIPSESYQVVKAGDRLE